MAQRMGEVSREGLRYEPSERWVRALRGDEAIVDSKRPVVVWLEGEVVPRYAFPPEDVIAGIDTQPLDDPDLAGLVLVPWDAADKWLEEEEEMVGHARDPFSRIDVRASSRRVRIERDGQLLAESSRPLLLFETGLPTRYYVPLEDVRAPVEPSKRHTQCAYKGVASYFTVGGYRDIAWYYPDPLPGLEQIRGHVAFFNERTDITVDGEPLHRPATQWSSE
jgi:uncharacterized protein (DUF427 family)